MHLNAFQAANTYVCLQRQGINTSEKLQCFFSVICIPDIKEGKMGKQCDCMEFTAYADKYSLCKEPQPLIFSEI